MAINSVDVLSENLAAWGIRVVNYEYDGTSVDFQDLMIRITEKRASAVEAEIKPMSLRMKRRNTQLTDLGNALAIIGDIQSKFENNEGDDSKESTMKVTPSAQVGLALVGCSSTVDKVLKLKKSECEYYYQALKTQIDARNNEASKDMTRLQSLVDKRDESYSTATSLMQSIGETRTGTIKNM